MMWGWDYFGGTWWIGMIWMVLFWGAIIALGIWAIKKLSGHRESDHKNNALDIARERYARGEITKEEFEQIKRTIS